MIKISQVKLIEFRNRFLERFMIYKYIVEENGCYTHNIRLFIRIFLPFVSIIVPPASRTITIPAAISQAWRPSIWMQSTATRATYAMLIAADPMLLVLNLIEKYVSFTTKKIILIFFFFLIYISRFIHYTIYIYRNIIMFTKHYKLCKCKFVNFNIYEKYYIEKTKLYVESKKVF